MEWVQIILPPLLVLIGGVVGWVIKSRTEELRAVEERLRGERRRIYGEILDPYIELFANLKQEDEGRASIEEKIISKDYRKAIWELGLLGSDEVVRAYNGMMQYFFNLGSNGKQDIRVTVRLWGKLRLEIRKSLGNKNTKLDELDMLRGEIIDIDKFLDKS
ncbi:MAG: hypothetical protein KKD83_10300 [Chloroflexi bacterium]|nr:hypothetical protein [Chloroflexota bacterium]